MKFLAAIFVFFTLLTSNYGQEPCPVDVGCGRTPRYTEYGNVRFSDERGVLDNLAVQLRNWPNEIAYFLIYAGQTSCIDEAKKRAVRAKNYLVHKHGIRSDRVLWKDGGFRVDQSTEIWLVPRGKQLPEPSPMLSRAHVRVVRCSTKGTQHKKR